MKNETLVGVFGRLSTHTVSNHNKRGFPHMFEKNAAGPGERMAETRKVLRNKSDDPRSIQEHPEVIMMKPTKGLFRALFAFAAIVFSVCVIPDVASKVHDQPSTVINVGNTIANEPEAASFGTPQRILASDGTAFEGFGGSSVAISGDTAVVGASADDVNGNTDQGSLYIFTKKNGTWTETQHLTAPDAVARMFYGISVSLSGNTLAVGTSGTPAGYNPGVYIYTRCGGLWSFQQKIVAPLDPSDPQYPDGFAQSVAVSGDTVVIGAPSDDFGSGNTTLNIGSGFVYTRTGTEWTLQQKLAPSTTTAAVGQSVAISGETLVLGQGGNVAWVFVRSGNTWTVQQGLTGTGGTFFNIRVAMDGDTVVVGSSFDDVNGATDQGSMYVFVRSGTTWSQQARLTADDGQAFDSFGYRVAIKGNVALVGAIGDDLGALTSTGSAYLFSRSGTVWTQDAKFVKPDTAAQDGAGSALALSGTDAIVGVPGDDINANSGQGSAWVMPVLSDSPLTGDRSKTSFETGSAEGGGCQLPIEVNVTSDREDFDHDDEICDSEDFTTGEQCSLRAAIQTANATAGADTINFNIEGSGIHTIAPTNDLPAITDTIILDATTQTGYSDKPLIQLFGGNSGVAVGLNFASGSDGSALKGLAVNRFPGIGLKIASNGVNVQESYFGLDADGLTIPADGQRQSVGIEITGKNNTVGGERDATDVPLGNTYITGNVRVGIEIRGANATGNKVVGTNFGFLDDLQTPAPDQITLTQVQIGENASNNTIGSLPMLERNIMVNALTGISIEGAAHHNFVIGNVIAQTFTGIYINGAHDNTVGGIYNSGARNFLVDNEFGIQIGPSPSVDPLQSKRVGASATRDGDLLQALAGSAPSVGNKIQGNVVGLNPTGDPFLGPNDYGIVVAFAEETEIGTGEFGEHNFVGNSHVDGIVITMHASGTKVRGNFIGTDLTGQSLGANHSGLVLYGSGTTATNNVISGNNDDGVRIIAELEGDPTPSGNTISNNTIGTNGAGTAQISNGRAGIYLYGDQNTVSGNTISGNEESGLVIPGSNNQIINNQIGTNKAGTEAVANGRIGVAVIGSFNRISGNTISGNNASGMLIAPGELNGAAPDGNIIVGNKIGTTSDGTSQLYNAYDGITIAVASNTRIGGHGPDIPADRNIISGNRRDGVRVFMGAANTRISGNFIGVTVDGSSPLGNNGNGVAVGKSATATTVGGSEPNAGNIIGNNGKHGVYFAADPPADPNVSTQFGSKGRSFGSIQLGTSSGAPQFIQGNWIGVKIDQATGAVKNLGNNGAGILVEDTAGVEIGGSGAGNTIGKNNGPGIDVKGIQAIATKIKGNLIGVGKNNLGEIVGGLGNLGDGIKIALAKQTNVGGSAAGEGNIIGSNTGHGINITTTVSEPPTGEETTVIEGNSIGAAFDQVAGVAKNLSNTLSGILAKDTPGVRIGGVGAAAGNQIGKNGGPGIDIDGAGSDGTVIKSNTIGGVRNASGEILTGLGNLAAGIRNKLARNTKIGGDQAGEGNVILGNDGPGIDIDGPGGTEAEPSGIEIKGNEIGAAFDNVALAVKKLGNKIGGIRVTNTVGIKIGGASHAAGNRIAGNDGPGIDIQGIGAIASEIKGNVLGGVRNDKNEVIARLGNLGDNLRIAAALQTIIGGTSAEEGNVIINAGGNGISVIANASKTKVFRNLIGRIKVDEFTDENAGNAGDGIFVVDSAEIQIGDADAGNVITGNQGDGIKLERADDARIVSNQIGVYQTLLKEYWPDGNGENGISLIDSDNCQIGDLDDKYTNLIAASQKLGLLLDQVTEITKVHNNMFGSVIRNIGNLEGTLSQNFGNGHGGIRISNGSNRNVIGGPLPNSGNTIANNGGTGVWVDETAGSGNLVDPNSIFGNLGPGIDLGAPGRTRNDPGDADTGPNNLQNSPELVSIDTSSGDLVIGFKIDSAPENSAYGENGIRVEFFKADASGEGERFLGSTQYTLADHSNGSPGVKIVDLGPLPSLGIAPNDRITSTATDADGNTSEFYPTHAGISGRAVDERGRGIAKTTVTATDAGGNVVAYAHTNSFGYFILFEVPTGKAYTISASSRLYIFQQPVVQLALSDVVDDLRFVGIRKKS